MEIKNQVFTLIEDGLEKGCLTEEFISLYYDLFKKNPYLGIEEYLYPILGMRIIDVIKSSQGLEVVSFGSGRFFLPGIQYDESIINNPFFRKKIDLFVHLKNKEFIEGKKSEEARIPECVCFIEIKGSSSYNYILGGANRPRDNQMEHSFLEISKELLSLYRNYVKESKEFIGIDSLWGDIYKLQNLINFWTEVLDEQRYIKGTVDFCGVAVGYANGSKTEKELKAFEKMFDVYKEKSNSYNVNLSKEIIVFEEGPKDLVMILVKVNKI